MKRTLGWLGFVHGRVVHSRRVRVLTSHFAELIPHGHSVLDVGCGDGRLAASIVGRRADLRFAGVDVLVRPAGQLALARFDGVHLPFGDQSWDTVMLCDVLHHAEQPVRLLQEAVRVARHCVVIKDHLVQGLFARQTLRLMDFVGNAPHGIVLPYNYLTPGQWADAFRQCHLVARGVRHELRLYPRWSDVFFGRRLHFVGAYTVERDAT